MLAIGDTPYSSTTLQDALLWNYSVSFISASWYILLACDSPTFAIVPEVFCGLPPLALSEEMIGKKIMALRVVA